MAKVTGTKKEPQAAVDCAFDTIIKVLGKYALILGNGYKIHGTKWKELLGTHYPHGCVAVGDEDLEYLYKNVKIGTKVYIY